MLALILMAILTRVGDHFILEPSNYTCTKIGRPINQIHFILVVLKKVDNILICDPLFSSLYNKIQITNNFDNENMNTKLKVYRLYIPIIVNISDPRSRIIH